MYIIFDNKNRALDVKAHEEIVSENAEIYYNAIEKKWAVKVSGKFDHRLPKVRKLGEGWICD